MIDILLTDLFPFAATFFLVFGVVYGLLSISNVFGIKTTKGVHTREGDKYAERTDYEIRGHRKVNGIIAIVFGLFAASYPPTVAFVQEFIPVATIILVIIFFLALIKKVVIGDFSKSGKGGRDAVPPLVMLASLVIFVAAAQSSGWLSRFWGGVPGFELETVLWVFGALVVVMIFAVAWNYGKSEKSE